MMMERMMTLANTNKLVFDLTKPIYAKEKETEEIFAVDGIYLPLGRPSGKDITVATDDGTSEWRSIDEIELIQHE